MPFKLYTLFKMFNTAVVKRRKNQSEIKIFKKGQTYIFEGIRTKQVLKYIFRYNSFSRLINPKVDQNADLRQGFLSIK